MTLNVQLAEKVLAKIHAHPEMHYQGTWIDTECGTTACIAGHAMLASGEYVRQQNGNGNWFLVDKATGHVSRPAETGARLLGLDPDVAMNIFLDTSEHSAIHKLQRLVNEAKRSHQHHTPTKKEGTS